MYLERVNECHDIIRCVEVDKRVGGVKHNCLTKYSVHLKFKRKNKSWWLMGSNSKISLLSHTLLVPRPPIGLWGLPESPSLLFSPIRWNTWIVTIVNMCTTKFMCVGYYTLSLKYLLVIWFWWAQPASESGWEFHEWPRWLAICKICTIIYHNYDTLIYIPSCFRDQGNLDYCIMSRSFEAKVSGHASMACMVGKVETQRIKITESDKTISCKARKE